MESFLPWSMIFTIVVAVVFFIRLPQSVKRGERSKLKAMACYSGLTLVPGLLLLLFALALVGIEELLGKALVPELFGRGLVVALAGCLTISIVADVIFALRLAFIRGPQGGG